MCLSESDHTSDCDAERSNSDPYRIRGPNRQALEGHRKHHDADEGPDKADGARPKLCEPVREFECELAEAQLVRLPAAEFGREGETVVRAYLAHRSAGPVGPPGRLSRQALLRRAEG